VKSDFIVPTIRRMTLDDLQAVLEIDELSFPLPWSAKTYRFELKENPAAELSVAEIRENGRQRVIGYIGSWFIVDEIHISTLAVHPDYRRAGIGRKLLETVLYQAIRKDASIVTLEVRVSNHIAQNLYRRYGFKVVGSRKGYYRDNNEDAFLMTLDDLNWIRVRVSGGEA
jgi:ribosomal-protein-alanine N-acetyltransferase